MKEKRVCGDKKMNKKEITRKVCVTRNREYWKYRVKMKGHGKDWRRSNGTVGKTRYFGGQKSLWR